MGCRLWAVWRPPVRLMDRWRRRRRRWRRRRRANLPKPSLASDNYPTQPIHQDLSWPLVNHQMTCVYDEKTRSKTPPRGTATQLRRIKVSNLFFKHVFWGLLPVSTVQQYASWVLCGCCDEKQYNFFFETAAVAMPSFDIDWFVIDFFIAFGINIFTIMINEWSLISHY